MTRKEEIKEWAEDFSSLYEFQSAYMCGAIKADEHPKNPWRALSKELPPAKQRVFFLDTNGIPHIGRLEIGGQIVVSAETSKDNITLTHWMPIPETPKGDEG